jgi:aminoglycoside phosphotransferase (APT) family kinase protein
VPDRSPLALAALACAAVRGLEPVAAAARVSHDPEVDAADVEDDLGRRWVVRVPRTTTAAARLDAEARLVAGLAGWLPFSVPELAGRAPLPDGTSAAVTRALAGEPLDPAALVPGPGLATALGRSIAAVHDLPERVVEEAGLPVYTAEQYRLRRLAEVDRAASTGHIPAGLLARWEKAIEEAGAWRFMPCVVHGDLATETVLTEHADVAGVLEWGEARVADPADDLAWVVAAADEAATESVLEAYANTRRSPVDRDLARRARLASELACARWLLHGVGADDADVVDDAVAMLTDLDAAVDGHPW